VPRGWAINPRGAIFEEKELAGDLDFMRRNQAVRKGWILLEWTEDGTLTVEGTPNSLRRNTDEIEEIAEEAFPRRTVFLDEQGREISTTTDVRSIEEQLTRRIRFPRRPDQSVTVRPHRRRR
jgi:hypothetical protein